MVPTQGLQRAQTQNLHQQDSKASEKLAGYFASVSVIFCIFSFFIVPSLVTNLDLSMHLITNIISLTQQTHWSLCKNTGVTFSSLNPRSSASSLVLAAVGCVLFV